MEHGDRWVVILAGGSGTRLAPLTRALYGVDVPKQFAVLRGGRSLLQGTVERGLQLVDVSRIMVVVAAAHAALARAQLAEWPRIELVVQPRNLDTGAGIVLPLAILRSQNPEARVVFMPADHHFERPAAVVDTLHRLEKLSAGRRGPPVLLGAVPDRPDTEYGWIEPGEGLATGLRAVRRFVEKPPSPVAAALQRSGALWNTFIMTGVVERLWAIARARLPQHTAVMARCVAPASPPAPSRTQKLELAYGFLPPSNFSREVLEHAEIEVMVLGDAGWSDWGTPERVLESLRGTHDHHRLLDRIQTRTRRCTRPRAAVL